LNTLRFSIPPRWPDALLAREADLARGISAELSSRRDEHKVLVLFQILARMKGTAPGRVDSLSWETRPVVAQGFDLPAHFPRTAWTSQVLLQ
jgi:hypothetical protein